MGRDKTVKLYVAMNKNKTLSVTLEEPHRDMERYVWKAPHLYVNSRLHPEIKKIAMSIGMTWDNDPEYMVFHIVDNS